MIGLSRAVGVRHLPPFDRLGPHWGFAASGFKHYAYSDGDIGDDAPEKFINKTVACK